MAVTSIYDCFIQLYREAAVNSLTVAGDPPDSTATKGALISRAHHHKILDYIRKGKESGATLLFGGERVGDKGYFVQNTAFTNVSDDAEIMQEEIFGPVAVSHWLTMIVIL